MLKLFPMMTAMLLTGAFATPSIADSSMAPPSSQSSAMTGGSAPMKPGLQKKTTKPMAKTKAIPSTGGMSMGAMNGMPADHMAAKPADNAMKNNMSSH